MIKSFADFRKFLMDGYFFYKDDTFYDNTGKVFLVIFACVVGAYLLGSLNFGVMISKLKYGVDIRTKGSGNAGATNMMRTYGKKAAALTFLGDMLKTALAVCLGYFLLGYWGAYLTGLFGVIGHAYPLFFNFKGGKGVVAISTMCLLTEPIVFLIMLLIFIIILYGYKMVSLASIMICLTYPMVLSLAGRTIPYGPHILLAALTSALVIFLHRSNIKRIYNHTESKVNLGKKKEQKKSYKDEDEQ